MTFDVMRCLLKPTVPKKGALVNPLTDLNELDECCLIVKTAYLCFKL